MDLGLIFLVFFVVTSRVLGRSGASDDSDNDSNDHVEPGHSDDLQKAKKNNKEPMHIGVEALHQLAAGIIVKALLGKITNSLNSRPDYIVVKNVSSHKPVDGEENKSDITKSVEAKVVENFGSGQVNITLVHDELENVTNSSIVKVIGTNHQKTSNDVMCKHLVVIFTSVFNMNHVDLLKPTTQLDQIVVLHCQRQLVVRPSLPQIGSGKEVVRVVVEIHAKSEGAQVVDKRPTLLNEPENTFASLEV